MSAATREGFHTVTAARPLKPKLRGWLHAGALPVSLLAGFALVAFGPTLQARLAAMVYAIASAQLFGVSAAYHRGRLSPRWTQVLRRLDHANIYLIIAGTYTPFAWLALHGAARVIVLSVIWIGAAGGIVFRMVWIGAPRWLYTTLYIGLGWAAVFFLRQLISGADIAAVLLVLMGGAFYSAGGVVYGLRRPDPSPRWFGFHEVFHALTLAAYIVQYVAVSLVVYGAA